MKFSRKDRLPAIADIDVTTFMNLMVILVPFLLVTAVFSRMTVLQLQLPPKDAQGIEAPEVQLQLAVTPERWQLRSNDTQVITELAPPTAPAQWRAFTEALVAVKQRFPSERQITLWFAKELPYKQVLEIMDHVREGQVVSGTQVVTLELFPDIALGRSDQAPPLAAPQGPEPATSGPDASAPAAPGPGEATP